ncbi:MAG: hypothetical protein IKB15_00880 [Alistipes sp.]|nr:hypothetical protein [Alistipes sp.]
MSETTRNRRSTKLSKHHNEEDEELRKRRIRREIVRIEAEEEEDEELDEDEEIDEESDEEDEDDTEDIEDDEVDDDTEESEEDEEGEDADKESESDSNDEADETTKPQSKSLWRHIVTGGFITSDGALQYYRYLIAIAIMCFISIFLTFMSLNADSEYRHKEQQVSRLRERSVLKSEERYRISSRDEVVRVLKEEHGIVMVDQKSSQRM